MSLLRRIKTKVRSDLMKMLHCSDRCDMPHLFCRGRGVEIGPMSNPYCFEKSVDVVYADIATPAELRAYRKSNPIPGLYSGEMPGIAILLSRPTFEFPTCYYSQFDFVYSSNVLEHHPNPVFFLLDQLKILKPGGVLYCKVPNKHFMYDRPRVPTSVSIFRKKFEDKSFGMTLHEAREIITQTGPHPNYDRLKLNVDENARKMVELIDGTHHFNVFEDDNVIELVKIVQSERSDVFIAHFSALQGENIEFALKIMSPGSF